jgi:uncharacterized protein YeaO (DUF488 family)
MRDTPKSYRGLRRRYQSEIRQHPNEFDRLRTLAQQARITLVFSAHDEAHNDAVVLKDLLLSRCCIQGIDGVSAELPIQSDLALFCGG